MASQDASSSAPPLPSLPKPSPLSFVSGTTIENTPPELQGVSVLVPRSSNIEGEMRGDMLPPSSFYAGSTPIIKEGESSLPVISGSIIKETPSRERNAVVLVPRSSDVEGGCWERGDMLPPSSFDIPTVVQEDLLRGPVSSGIPSISGTTIENTPSGERNLAIPVPRSSDVESSVNEESTGKGDMLQPSSFGTPYVTKGRESSGPIPSSNSSQMFPSSIPLPDTLPVQAVAAHGSQSSSLPVGTGLGILPPSSFDFVPLIQEDSSQFIVPSNMNTISHNIPLPKRGHHGDIPATEPAVQIPVSPKSALQNSMSLPAPSSSECPPTLLRQFPSPDTPTTTSAEPANEQGSLVSQTPMSSNTLIRVALKNSLSIVAPSSSEYPPTLPRHFSSSGASALTNTVPHADVQDSGIRPVLPSPNTPNEVDFEKALEMLPLSSFDLTPVSQIEVQISMPPPDTQMQQSSIFVLGKENLKEIEEPELKTPAVEDGDNEDNELPVLKMPTTTKKVSTMEIPDSEADDEWNSFINATPDECDVGKRKQDSDVAMIDEGQDKGSRAIANPEYYLMDIGKNSTDLQTSVKKGSQERSTMEEVVDGCNTDVGVQGSYMGEEESLTLPALQTKDLLGAGESDSVLTNKKSNSVAEEGISNNVEFASVKCPIADQINIERNPQVLKPSKSIRTEEESHELPVPKSGYAEKLPIEQTTTELPDIDDHMAAPKASKRADSLYQPPPREEVVKSVQDNTSAAIVLDNQDTEEETLPVKSARRSVKESSDSTKIGQLPGIQTLDSAQEALENISHLPALNSRSAVIHKERKSHKTSTKVEISAVPTLAAPKLVKDPVNRDVSSKFIQETPSKTERQNEDMDIPMTEAPPMILNEEVEEHPVPSSPASSFQLPSVVIDFPPIPSLKPDLPAVLQEGSEKRKAKHSEELTSPTEPAGIPSSPSSPLPTKKPVDSPAIDVKSPKKSKDELLFDELKNMKIASLASRNANLQADISRLHTKLAETTKKLKFPAAETVKKHIKLLHDYNDIRDVGQGLLGMIAENRGGLRVGELYEEFGVGLKD